jgi:hypothetical protein
MNFIHHKLLAGPDGQKLAKSRDHGDLWTLMKHGMPAEEMWVRLSTLMGLLEPITKVSDLLNLNH